MWPRMPDRVLASTPEARAWVAKVCSGVQRLDFLLPGIAGRQDKDGGLLQLTQTADNCHAVYLGKLYIQNYQDVVEPGVSIHCLDIGGRMINLQAGVPQAVCNLLPQFLFLRDDQRFALCITHNTRNQPEHRKTDQAGANTMRRRYQRLRGQMIHPTGGW